MHCRILYLRHHYSYNYYGKQTKSSRRRRKCFSVLGLKFKAYLMATLKMIALFIVLLLAVAGALSGKSYVII